MIVTLQQLKDVLGIADNTQDAMLTTSLAQANGLISAYIGYDVSDTTTIHEYTYTPEEPMHHRHHWSWSSSRRHFVHLPYWPVRELVEVLQADGTSVSSLDYRLIAGPGRVDFFNGLPMSDYLTFRFRAGYDPVPDDLPAVALNLGSTIFNNGGSLGATNQLKSLTMFDAMSMAFDTTPETSNNAQGLLNAWAFVLDKYRVLNKPVLK